MKLDEYQENARLDQGAKVLLVAPPGSGKTTVLLAKIEYLIKELNIPAEAILVLTFSRSASANMKARFEKLRLEPPFFGTIHSFAWHEIRKRQQARELITEAQALAALTGLRRKYSLSLEEIAGCISDISRERSTGQCDETIPPEFRREVRAAYSTYKKANALLDFDDLEEELLVLLADDVLRAELQGRYRWILVDEFQDLNRVQLTILKLISNLSHLFCVGDEDQCIYAFRGSDTSAMIRFEQEFEGGRILYLKYNYRSSASIVAYANGVIRHNQERYPKEIVNFRRDETKLTFIRCPAEGTGLDYSIETIRQLGPAETAALIVRTNGELEKIAHTLVKQRIRFGLLDRVYNKYQKRLYRTLIDYLKYAVGGAGQKSRFLTIIRRPGIGLSGDALNRLETKPLLIEQDLLDNEKFDLTAHQREGLIGWFHDVETLKGLKPGPAIRYILYVMGYFRYLEQLAQATGAPFQELMQEVEQFAKEASSFGDLSAFLRYIEAFDEVCRQRDDSAHILLSTMHGVKGMEFDQVFILNAIEGKIPHEKALHEIEAERRLYYVAVTRARHELTVLSPDTYQGKLAKPSRFLEESAARYQALPASFTAAKGRTRRADQLKIGSGESTDPAKTFLEKFRVLLTKIK